MRQKKFPGYCQVAQKLETTLQPFIGLGFPLTCMENVDHDRVWRASLNEVRQRKTHAPSCMMNECDGHCERRLLSQKQNYRTPLRLWTESAAGLMDEGMKMGARVEGDLQQVC